MCLQELHDLPQPVHAQLRVDGTEVGGLALPEVDLDDRVRVLPVLQGVLGVLLQDVADLLRPGDDRPLQDVDAVLVHPARVHRLPRPKIYEPINSNKMA